MPGTMRCDEILSLIDEVLDEPPPVPTGSVRFHPSVHTAGELMASLRTRAPLPEAG